MAPRQFQSFSEITNFIWSLADLLRGDYKQSEYGKIILPLTVLRRLDCVLESTKEEVLAKAEELEDTPIKNVEPILNRAAGVNFHNTSQLDFERLTGDPDNISKNLQTYINSFSSDAREIIDRFSFRSEIQKLDRENLLYLLVKEFAKIDLHPDVVSNTVMGSIFEELIRRFSEQSNETAGEHFTPREVIGLMVNLLFSEDEEALTREGIVRTLYDPACGTGGMLSVAEERLRELNPDGQLEVFGQELNDESYAICKADMLIKGQDPDRIVHGNSFTEDGHPDMRFDYMLSNPPFGVSWKKVKQFIEDERKTQGLDGRFGAGTPRVNDGSLLFLQHMLSKMKPGGSRIAIVFNESPLFKGGAGSGESSIRQWIIENDWLETVVALPEELFYNTPINTYIWLLTNDKDEERKGKVQLVDAREFWEQMPKSLGNKRKRFSPEHIAGITEIHDAFVESEHSKIFDNEDFGYREIVIERPLRLNFRASDERIERLKDERAFQNRDEEKQGAIVEVLRDLDGERLYRDREAFEEVLDEAFNVARVDLTSSLRGNILSALGERDKEAEICRDNKGDPEHDTDLRDRERVPLKEDVEKYFRREVAPYLSDAWINHNKTRVGYEVPLTRYFYQYDPPRPLGDVRRELRDLQDGIDTALDRALATGVDAREVIARAVTRGVDGARPLKTVAAPWFEQLPQSWDTVRIRFVARLESGHTPSRSEPDYWIPSECTIPWVTLADVWQLRDERREYLEETQEKISERGMANSGARLLPEGTVVLSRTASIGFAGIMAQPMATSQDFANWVCGPELLPEFLLYVFRAMKSEFSRFTSGSTHQTIYMPEIRRLVTPIPPHEEQERIVQELRDRLNPLQAAIKGAEEQIERLSEYREALLRTGVAGALGPSEVERVAQ